MIQSVWKNLTGLIPAEHLWCDFKWATNSSPNTNDLYICDIVISYTSKLIQLRWHCHVRIEKGSVQTVDIQLDSLEYQYMLKH